MNAEIPSPQPAPEQFDPVLVEEEITLLGVAEGLHNAGANNLAERREEGYKSNLHGFIYTDDGGGDKYAKFAIGGGASGEEYHMTAVRAGEPEAHTSVKQATVPLENTGVTYRSTSGYNNDLQVTRVGPDGEVYEAGLTGERATRAKEILARRAARLLLAETVSLNEHQQGSFGAHSERISALLEKRLATPDVSIKVSSNLWSRLQNSETGKDTLDDMVHQWIHEYTSNNSLNLKSGTTGDSINSISPEDRIRLRDSALEEARARILESILENAKFRGQISPAEFELRLGQAGLIVDKKGMTVTMRKSREILAEIVQKPEVMATFEKAPQTVAV